MKKWVARTFRLVVFWTYLFGLISLGFVVIWGWNGFLFSVPLNVFFFSWIRFTGYRNICRRLDLRAIGEIPPFLPHVLAELSRRFAVTCPTLFRLESLSLNVGSFGFSRHRSAIVVTPGVLNLPRNELVVLLAREMASIAQYRTEFATWHAEFVHRIDKLSGATEIKNTIAFRVFLRETFFWPFTIFPAWCLRWSVSQNALDRISICIAAVSPRALSEVFRKIEISQSRSSLSIPASDRQLFLLPPENCPHAARAFFESDSLLGRIRVLENR